MFSFTESVDIYASLDQAWAYLVDVEKWWIASNPDHYSLEVLNPGAPFGKGMRIRIREKVAGIAGEAVGEVTEYVEREHVAWQAEHARYRLWGVALELSEGVRWSLRLSQQSVSLSATVWAIFPPGLKGFCMEWLFRGPLRGELKDRLHTRRELEYIKQQIERGQ